MPQTPTCAGEERVYVCGLCGRPPVEPCATSPIRVKKQPCYGCDGTGEWPKGTGQDCLMCAGSGEWSE